MPVNYAILVKRPEVRLLFYIIGLYSTFLYWGILQEKLATSHYQNYFHTTKKWSYPLVLNMAMSITCFFVAVIVENFFKLYQKNISFLLLCHHVPINHYFPKRDHNLPLKILLFSLT